MSSKRHPRIWLSEIDLETLARLPITHGSVPANLTPRQWQSWHKMVRKVLIVGCPGDWSVLWGRLTKGQYRKVELYRRGL